MDQTSCKSYSGLSVIDSAHHSDNYPKAQAMNQQGVCSDMTTQRLERDSSMIKPRSCATLSPLTNHIAGGIIVRGLIPFTPLIRNPLYI